MAGDVRMAPQADNATAADATADATTDAKQAKVKSAFSITLGILLGIVCAVPTSGEMGLRVPALLAALVMVAQGLLDLGRVRQERLDRERQEQQDAEGRERAAQAKESHARQQPAGTALEGRVLGPGEAPPRDDARAAQRVPPVVARTPKESMTIPMLVLGLAVWLGLAVIGLDASAVLRGLSLLAAFLLFSHGWSLLPARR